MSTYVMLTTLDPQATKNPAEIRRLEKAVMSRIREQAPEVKWKASYGILGPCDYLDLFEAPSEEDAARVALIVRSFGHARTELWTAIPWERLKELLPAA